MEQIRKLLEKVLQRENLYISAMCPKMRTKDLKNIETKIAELRWMERQLCAVMMEEPVDVPDTKDYPDLEKALRCIASQTPDGDCYLERHAMRNASGVQMVCSNKPLEGEFSCPYHQRTYSVNSDDFSWLNQVADIIALVYRYTLEKNRTKEKFKSEIKEM